jgi:hypothetical protein
MQAFVICVGGASAQEDRVVQAFERPRAVANRKAPTPLPPEVVRAWQQAGARVLRMPADQRRFYPAFYSREPYFHFAL